LSFCLRSAQVVVKECCGGRCRVGVITDPPLQESVSDPQTLLDALEEPVTEPLTLTPTDTDVSF